MKQFRADPPIPTKALPDPLFSGFEPRIQRRGVRVGPDLWGSEDFPEHLDFLTAIGVNTIALDGVRLPVTLDSVEAEDAPGEWLDRIEPKVRSVQESGLNTILTLPIQLDLHPTLSRTAEGSAGIGVFCRQRPSGRRQTLHRFENLVRTAPSVDGFGFILSNWGRCRCPLCEATSFEEEAAYYLRAFTAVLQRHAPEAIVWAFPDERVRNGLREVQSQVPPGTRLAAPSPEIKETAADRTGGRIGDETAAFDDEEGEVFPLGGRLDVDLFQGERMRCTVERWENDRAPRTLFGDLHRCQRLPVNSLSLLGLYFQAPEGAEDVEERVYRFLLPGEEKANWRYWRDFCQETVRQATSIRSHGTPRPFSNFPRIERGVETANPFDFFGSLARVESRLRTDRSLSEIEADLSGIPDGVRIHGEIARRIQEVREKIQDLLFEPTDSLLEECERRVLESLASALGLMISDGGGRKEWSREDLPDPTPLRLHRLSAGTEVSEI